MRNKIVTIIGGTGFVGRYVVKLLAEQGYSIRVIARDPEAASYLKTAGDVGQISLVSGNLAKPESLIGKLDNSWAVINLVGVLFESGKQNFSSLHAQGAEKLAQLAKQAGAERFVQISAIGADKIVKSKYANTKLTGEKAVKAAFPEATIIRPSIIFGVEDQFFNLFAGMSRFSPILPLIGGGVSKFQPIYVVDVAKAILAVLQNKDSLGEIYEIGGAKIYSFKEILEFICKITGRKRCLLNISFTLAGVIGYFGELLPKPPLTRDQLAMLEYDNVVSIGAKNLSDLGITPQAVEAIVPNYLR